MLKVIVKVPDTFISLSHLYLLYLLTFISFIFLSFISTLTLPRGTAYCTYPTLTVGFRLWTQVFRPTDVGFRCDSAATQPPELAILKKKKSWSGSGVIL